MTDIRFDRPNGQQFAEELKRFNPKKLVLLDDAGQIMEIGQVSMVFVKPPDRFNNTSIQITITP